MPYKITDRRELRVGDLVKCESGGVFGVVLGIGDKKLLGLGECPPRSGDVWAVWEPSLDEAKRHVLEIQDMKQFYSLLGGINGACHHDITMIERNVLPAFIKPVKARPKISLLIEDMEKI